MKQRTFRANVEKAYQIIRNEAGTMLTDETNSSASTEDSGDVVDVLGEVLRDLNDAETGRMNRDVESLYESRKRPELEKEVVELPNSDVPPQSKKRKRRDLQETTAPITTQKQKNIGKNTHSLSHPKARFSDLGGIDDVLVELNRLLLHLLHPEVFEHLGVTAPRGFLLHGPPGCGKTLLANAIAGEHFNFPPK